MNKLYLLALLGLAVNADVGLGESSNGWYAGDCFDEADFSSYYGYVSYDCGDTCAEGNNNSEGYDWSVDYPDCFEDDWTSEEEEVCVAYSYSCSLSEDDDATCEANVVACAGDADCSETAVCNGADDCISSLDTAVAAFESEYGSDFDDSTDSEGRRKKLRTPKVLADYPIRSGLYLYGLDTIDSSYPVYCDHYHLYSFGYDTVTPVSDSDFSTDLVVTGWSMVGFPNLCSYSDWAAISSPIPEETVWATSADQFAWTCGWYVEYEWNGNDDLWFEVGSMNAVATAVSAIALATVGSLLF